MKEHRERHARQEEARSAKIAELETDLAAARIEIESLKAALAECEGASGHQQRALAEARMLLDEQVAELERQRVQFRREQEDFYRRETERPDASVCERPAESCQESPQQLDVHDPGEAKSPPTEPPEPNASVAAARPDPSVEDDESVEDYVARMMHRMGVNRQQSPIPVAAPLAVARVEARVQEQSAPSEPVSQVVDISSAEEYVPRSQAPESGTDMATMRALANDAAAAALRAHARHRSNLLAARSSVVAVVSLVGSAAIATAWHFTHSPVGLYGASFFGVLGAGCSFKTLWHRYRSFALSRGSRR